MSLNQQSFRKNIKGEIWKIIEEYPNYEISNKGRVLSHYGGRETLMKIRLDRYGYWSVCLTNKLGQKYKTVHRLVARAFLGESDLTVNHINGNKLNNCVENLEYMTRKENSKQAGLNGLMSRGEEHYNARLSELKVKLIFYKRSKGKILHQIANEVGISKTHVFQILNGIKWKNYNFNQLNYGNN